MMDRKLSIIACAKPSFAPTSAGMLPASRRDGGATRLEHEVLRSGMVGNDGGRGLLRVEEESAGQAHSDILFGMKQGEELGLVFEIGARGIAERIARAAIFLVKEIANVGRVFCANPQFFSHFLVVIFGERFGRFHA